MKLPHLLLCSAVAAASAASVFADPSVSRLTPPSLLFTLGEAGAPYISRFLPGQRFDLQATIRPDAGQTITSVVFKVDGVTVTGSVTLIPATVSGLPANTVCPTLRAYSNSTPGVRTLTVTATQSDNKTVTATGEFQIIGLTQTGRKAKNIIVMIGDGMGIAHRTAARIAYHNVVMGKSLAPLEMDDMAATALVKTSSLDNLVTDSSPGAACYSTGNKANNNQEGVFPDDTNDKFDNPRIEFMGEYLARSQGRALGIVTTADVFDATPAAFAVHTQDRNAGTGICDQYLDEAAVKANLKVLLGGGRKWFLPANVVGNGSARANSSDYTLGSDLTTGWGSAAGALDANRNLIADFQTAGFTYAPDKTTLTSSAAGATKLLGLFALSNMNVAYDKINGRRGVIPSDSTQSVVADYGFPDQPLLEEMTSAALTVLSKNPTGFVLMVEGASIDKQAHAMDAERWIFDTIEFDKAIGVAKQFAVANPDTLVYVTADHECAGVNILGPSKLTNNALKTLAGSASGIALRNNVTGGSGFPVYGLAPDSYPATMDVDYKMLIGYAAGVDRYEDWLSNPRPIQDAQQPFVGSSPLNGYPSDQAHRDTTGNFFITGQISGTNSAGHTASDIPLTASGRGSSLFKGVIDNTDVFFLAMQAALGGAN